ncbi:hypothetical protein CHLRE_07g355950v5 [Chlamydomonas reinhardtii]|uniref:Uncharacterized protein n=1 Tax=Chlamydomonas reinhardtii TaxID=3055 RepID=A0A2K3DLM2_CHLRE|nr:uncharacterized protein CHLRE_07g355950v5 [Chlamydomonas reinhardtii]PNW81435.1 hypothetical protein CHLRE_07g355950v5 [Chlamydomonas reinhardtii]
MAQVQAVIADLASEYERSRRFLDDLEQSLKPPPLAPPPPPRQHAIDEDADVCLAAPAVAAAGDCDSSDSEVDEDAAAPVQIKTNKIASKLKSMFSRGSFLKARSAAPQAAAAPAAVASNGNGGDTAHRRTRRPSIVSIGLLGGGEAGSEDWSPLGCSRAAAGGMLPGRTASFHQGAGSAAGRSHLLLQQSTSGNNMPLRRGSLDLYSSSAAAAQQAALLASGRMSMEAKWGAAPLACGGGGGPMEPAPQQSARRMSGVLAHTPSLRAMSLTAAGGGRAGSGCDTGGADVGRLLPLLAGVASEVAAGDRRHQLLRGEESRGGPSDTDHNAEEAGSAFNSQQASPSQRHAVGAGMRRASFTLRREGMGGSEAAMPDGGTSYPAAASGMVSRTDSMRRNSLLAGASSVSQRSLAAATDEDSGVPSPAAAAMLHSPSMRARPGSVPSVPLVLQSPSGNAAPGSGRTSSMPQAALLPDITASNGLGRVDSGRRLSIGNYGSGALGHAGSGLVHGSSSSGGGGPGSPGGMGAAGAAAAGSPGATALRIASQRRMSSGPHALVPTGANGFQGTMHVI